MQPTPASRDADRQAADAIAGGPDPDYDPLGRPEVAMWRQRWFQATLAVLLLLAVASYVVPALFRLLYEVRGVLTPVLIGLGLAYAFNPLVTWARRRVGVPRPVSAAGLLAGFVLVIVAAVPLILLPVVGQAWRLIQSLPASLAYVAERDDLPPALRPVVETANGVVLQVGEAVRATLQPQESAPIADDEAALTLATAEAEQAVDTLERAFLAYASEQGVVLSTTPGLESGQIQGQGQDPGLNTEPQTWSRWFDQTLAEVDWAQAGRVTLRVLDAGADAITSALGVAGYLVVAAVIVVFVFFFTVWKFDAFTQWFKPYLPASGRERTLEVLGMMDRSVSAFLRGRLIQATIMAAVLTVGLAFTDAARYALLLGVVGGVLGLIPYVGLVVWPASIMLAILAEIDSGQGISLVWAVIAPTVVFVAAQSLDGYVVEPLVQGKATDLDALTVLLVVLLGGSLAGLPGLLLAIPVAACVKILCREVVLPRLRRIAAAS